jgi:NRPS condensation-like uncharacterized protein
MRTEVSTADHVAVPGEELSGLEQLYYILDVNACVAIEVEGEASVDQWRAAIAKVASRAPLLSCRIVRNSTGLLVFESLSDVPLPFHVSSVDPREWRMVMAEEVSTRIPLGCGPLFRATLLHGPGRATLLLSLSHCIVDGRSALALLRDVLHTLVREPLGPPAIDRSIDSLLVAATARAWQPPSAPISAVQPRSTHANPEGSVHLEANCLDEKFMARLRVRAREEGTTVHGAISAALLTGFSRDVPGSGSLTSGIDVRPVLAPGQEGLRPVISSCTVRPGNECFSFWELARRIKAVFRRETTLEAIAELQSMVGEICTAHPTPELLRERLTRTFEGPEILLTNLGVLSIPLSYGAGSIKLKSFWGSMHPASQDGHFICCATVGGRLQMLYTASRPLPDLFSKLQAELQAAVL